MSGSVLLTGGTGRTASRIAQKLKSRGVSPLLASRRGQAGAPEGFKAVKFDWFDETTFAIPFETDANIETIYLVLPPSASGTEWVVLAKKFVDFSVTKGVRKFVLLGTAFFEKGGPVHGQVHAYFDEVGVDYAVLRPSAFFSNFIHTLSAKGSNEIISATGTAKLGFVSEDDIADAAVELLVTPKLGGVEKIVVGPELLSYDDVVAILSDVLGRKITHRSVSAEERAESYIKIGVSADIARPLAIIEANEVATGSEERLYHSPNRFVGKTRFRDFAEVNKAAW